MADSNRYDLDWRKVYEATTMGIKFLKDGEVRFADADGKKICMLRKGEQLFALKSRCPHAGGPMGNGFLDEDGNLVCPWHRFKFCPETGKDPSGEGYFLPTYPVEIRESGLYVGFPKRKKLFGLF